MLAASCTGPVMLLDAVHNDHIEADGGPHGGGEADDERGASSELS